MTAPGPEGRAALSPRVCGYHSSEPAGDQSLAPHGEVCVCVHTEVLQCLILSGDSEQHNNKGSAVAFMRPINTSIHR